MDKPKYALVNKSNESVALPSKFLILIMKPFMDVLRKIKWDFCHCVTVAGKRMHWWAEHRQVNWEQFEVAVWV